MVAYYPDAVALRHLLTAIRPQVDAVVLVDNSPVPRENDQLDDGVYAIRLERNVGLAAAQNIGIQWARRHDHAHVLLLDQDSIPGEGMVMALLDALVGLAGSGMTGAVGPRFRDLREDRDAPFVRIGFPFNRKRWCEHPGQTVTCDFLISSGALIPMAVLDAVGGMDEALFIDNVDLEWGFRARAKGYELHGVCAATMYHRLGDARRTMPFGLGHVVVHGSARLYYMMRNRVLLYRMPHTPAVWIAQDLPRIAAKLVLFGVMVGPRLRNLRYMLQGLYDGVRGRRGACPIRPPA
ncbi:glycosyltransferase family 2 protein [Rhodanobacter sp. 115]|uniref:glycosyltransferase family 2 protein n=1 Tax=Rhodanobacter sp. FW021-MT20 TaxID=1162282 RepID=UPI0002FD7BCA|nr:glycosyltransferase family 2 protein [Rhodanobacter sp. 115]